MAPTQTIGNKASEAIVEARQRIAESVVALEFARHPALTERYGPQARGKSHQDATYHIMFLAQALALENPAAFSEYVAWAKVVLVHRGVSSDDLGEHLRCLARALPDHIPADLALAAAAVVDLTIAKLPGMPVDLSPFIDESSPNAALARSYLDALLQSERHKAARVIHNALAAGLSIQDIYLDVFAPSQREVGRMWQMNQITVAQEHFCTAATQVIMAQTSPSAPAARRKSHSLVATSVAGDLHELGLRMVSDFFEMAGWTTIYLGASTPHGAVVDSLVATRSELLLISASIGYHVAAVEDLIRTVRAAPKCKGVRVFVGGYPFNQDPDLWKKIGADGYASDARSALDVAGETWKDAA